MSGEADMLQLQEHIRAILRQCKPTQENTMSNDDDHVMLAPRRPALSPREKQFLAALNEVVAAFEALDEALTLVPTTALQLDFFKVWTEARRVAANARDLHDLALTGRDA
jgi:hypothetical protein